MLEVFLTLGGEAYGLQFGVQNLFTHVAYTGFASWHM